MARICVIDAVKSGREIWMLEEFTNCLFSYDAENEKLSYAACVDNGFGNVMEYGTVEKKGERLYLFPLYTDNIAVYHLNTRKTDLIRLPDSFLELPVCNERYDKIAFAYTYKNRIYAFGADYPGILVLDTDTGELSCISMAEPLNGLLKDTVNGYFPYNYAVSETFLYVPVRSTNYICKFCLESIKYEIIQLKNDASFDGGCISDRKLWLVHYQEPKVTVLNENLETLKVIRLKGMEASEFCYSEIHSLGQNVCIHTQHYRISIQTTDYRIQIRKSSEKEWDYIREKVFDDKLYRFTIGNLLVWDSMDGVGEPECIKLQMDGAESRAVFKKMIPEEKAEGVVLTESFFWGLPELLDVIGKKDDGNKCRRNTGEEIFDMVRFNLERLAGREK